MKIKGYEWKKEKDWLGRGDKAKQVGNREGNKD